MVTITAERSQFLSDLCFLSGRFAVRDLKQTVAVGVIKSVEKVDQAKRTSQKAPVSK